ncbi:MAG TPA: hypothetical protein VF432_20025, partial [Thermoanaerobaculia bacterium]
RGRRPASRRDAGAPTDEARPNAVERRRLGGWPGGVLAAEALAPRYLSSFTRQRCLNEIMQGV